MIQQGFRASRGMRACPKCGQKTVFVAKSQQVQEDLCEVWVECLCGHDPHGPGDRMESVMGELSIENIYEAAGIWNDTIRKA